MWGAAATLTGSSVPVTPTHRYTNTPTCTSVRSCARTHTQFIVLLLILLSSSVRLLLPE